METVVEQQQKLPVERTEEKERIELDHTWSREPGILGFLKDTNHKEIGIRYIVTAFVFFTCAGILAMLMRIQLAFPENRFLGPDLYNQFFSTHGSAMMFLFATPVMQGVGIYVVPLMIGTRNTAFPRMTALGWWLFVIGGALLFIGLILNIGPDAGWFSYVPLSGPEYSPGKRVDFWAQMITFTEVSSLIAAVAIITTVFKQRAPGMSLNRIPIFVWAMVVQSFMIIFAMPSVMLASSFLMMDRMANVNTHFFNPAEGGDALLYQHIFWFFGHPEVYIIFIPGAAFVSTIVGTFSRRRVFGYTAMILSIISIGFIAFGLWVHHMFATPVADLGQSFFTSASMLVVIPNGIQFFCWIATMWTGRPVMKSPMYWVFGFLAIFLLGGLTGLMLASVPFDLQVHDTFFVVAHFHYVLIGGAVFPLFGAIYYWFPKMTGRMLNEQLGRFQFWLFFIGFKMTFFPMHMLGLNGMPRRIYTYLPDRGWGTMNFVGTVGAAVMGISFLIFLVNVYKSRRNGIPAGPDPWGGDSLEWATNSPPPDYNFQHIPVVHSRTPMWPVPAETAYLVGLRTDQRETIVTTTMDAEIDHKYHMPDNSIWPMITSLALGFELIGSIFHPWFFIWGAVPVAICLFFWFWEGHPHPEEE